MYIQFPLLRLCMQRQCLAETIAEKTFASWYVVKVFFCMVALKNTFGRSTKVIIFFAYF